MRRHRPLSNRQKRWIVGSGIVLFLALSLLVCWFAGRPLIRFARQPERFRDWVDQQGVRGPGLFVGMVILQIIVAVIPGEPLEIAGGYAFGALEGTLLCVLGAFLGRLLVFLLVRRFGTMAAEVFFPLEKLQSLRFLQNEKRLSFWVFLLFFLPGTPKDVLTYFVGLTRLPLRVWIFISLAAPLPSIITSTVGGNALGMGNYAFAAAVFTATFGISAFGIAAYRRICRKYRRE